MTNGDERFPPKTQAGRGQTALYRVSTMPLDQIAHDRVARVGADDTIEKPKDDRRRCRIAIVGRHGVSSPTSSPAAMRRNAKRFSRSARFPPRSPCSTALARPPAQRSAPPRATRRGPWPRAWKAPCRSCQASDHAAPVAGLPAAPGRHTPGRRIGGRQGERSARGRRGVPWLVC